MKRTASIQRKTKETNIAVSINLDGSGTSKLQSGIGFLDHMLEQIAKHGIVDLEILCKGDNHIDDHHSVEDIGIALGQALQQALGDKMGICRYGYSYAPLDEALSRTVIDLSGRACIEFSANFPTEKIGNFQVELFREFFTALAHNAKMTLHIDSIRGINSHHIAESIFKSFAIALRQAISVDAKRQGVVPSSKGVL
jgi:imidazoleglycerol-phosphate dehydratase